MGLLALPFLQLVGCGDATSAQERDLLLTDAATPDAAAAPALPFALDLSYATSGVAEVRASYPLINTSVRPDGAVVFLEDTRTFDFPQQQLCALTPSGAPQATFGAAGCRDFDHLLVFLSSGLSLAGDGRVVLSSSSFEPDAPTPTMIATVARFDDTGVIDASFGTGGVVPAATPWLGVSALVQERCGTYVLASIGAPSFDSAQPGLLLARLSSTGEVLATTHHDLVAPGHDLDPLHLQIDAQGGLVLAGLGVLARFDHDLHGVVGFGADGIVETGGLQVAVAWPLADGGLLVAGSQDGPALARYLPDGSLDATFGSAGVSAIAGHAGDHIAAAVRLPDGGVLLGGATSTDEGPRALVARFDADGAPAPGFGEGGRAQLIVGAGGVARIVGMDTLANGDVLITGQGTSATGPYAADFAWAVVP